MDEIAKAIGGIVEAAKGKLDPAGIEALAKSLEGAAADLRKGIDAGRADGADGGGAEAGGEHAAANADGAAAGEGQSTTTEKGAGERTFSWPNDLNAKY